MKTSSRIQEDKEFEFTIKPKYVQKEIYIKIPKETILKYRDKTVDVFFEEVIKEALHKEISRIKKEQEEWIDKIFRKCRDDYIKDSIRKTKPIISCPLELELKFFETITRLPNYVKEVITK